MGHPKGPARAMEGLKLEKQRERRSIQDAVRLEESGKDGTSIADVL